MNEITQGDSIVGRDEIVLITGSTGFIGTRVVRSLLNLGFQNVRCFARPSSQALQRSIQAQLDEPAVQWFYGNLLSREDCIEAARNVTVVIHLAASRGEKSFPDAFMNSVVTTRNLLDACVQHRHLKRFVNVSSFAVYTNAQRGRGHLLDETCEIESAPQIRGEAYSFAKVKQEQLVADYGQKYGVPYVIVRPGVVYGPGNLAITGRVGIAPFGFYLHLGGSNTVPLAYVDNCADAIALTATRPGIDGEIFNVVDDDLPSSRRFLRLYKQQVKWFPSIYVPKMLSYGFCYLWERYSARSQGQLPPVFNRSRWNSFWKKTSYTNQKLKTRVGWRPNLSTMQGLQAYFEACREGNDHA